MSSLLVTLRLNVCEPLTFQSFSGFSVRGFFYELLKSVEPSLAGSVHAGGALAPFSTSPLFVTFGSSSRVVWREAGAPSVGLVRFSLLDDGLARAFGKLLLGGGLKEVVLSEKRLPVTEVGVQEVRFEKLLESSQPVSKLRVRFRTPTYFRKTPSACCTNCPLYRDTLKARACGLRVKACPYYKLGRRYRFVAVPEPTLLFRSLVRLWRKFSKTRIDYEGFMGWVEGGGVALSGYPRGLRTFRVFEHPYAGKWVVGFMGTVHYDLPADTYGEKYAKLCDALLRFGEAANVGGGRTAGLGLIHYEPFKAPSEEKSSEVG